MSDLSPGQRAALVLAAQRQFVEAERQGPAVADWFRRYQGRLGSRVLGKILMGRDPRPRKERKKREPKPAPSVWDTADYPGER